MKFAHAPPQKKIEKRLAPPILNSLPACDPPSFILTAFIDLKVM